MKNILLYILWLSILSGCVEGNPDQNRDRIILFKECMVLASNIPRQADDDVADIVSTCSNQAYYMTLNKDNNK